MLYLNGYPKVKYSFAAEVTLTLTLFLLNIFFLFIFLSWSDSSQYSRGRYRTILITNYQFHLFTNIKTIFNFFFLSGFSFTTIHKVIGQQGKGEGISSITHFHLHLLHRNLDISQAITADSSPLHIVISRT